jgi:simple sugar transport system substrate-binding protein
VQSGSWKAQPVWGSIADGMVQLAAVQPTLPAALRNELSQRRQALAAGRAAPFEGRIVDQAGGVRLAAGRLDDAAIARMDWFVDGVIGTLPAAK